MLSNELKMIIVGYVVPKPPKGSSKTQKGGFPCKIALRFKKICYKVYLLHNSGDSDEIWYIVY